MHYESGFLKFREN
jgi:hypothetical protein